MSAQQRISAALASGIGLAYLVLSAALGNLNPTPAHAVFTSQVTVRSELSTMQLASPDTDSPDFQASLSGTNAVITLPFEGRLEVDTEFTFIRDLDGEISKWVFLSSPDPAIPRELKDPTLDRASHWDPMTGIRTCDPGWIPDEVFTMACRPGPTISLSYEVTYMKRGWVSQPKLIVLQ